MKVLSYIVKDLRLFKRDIINNFLLLFIFPIALSFCYGFFQDKAFQNASKIEKLYVTIDDKDNSESSKMIKEIFKHESLKDILEVKAAGGDIEVIIPQGFQNSLENSNKVTISINQLKKDALLQTHIVEGFLNSFSRNISIVNGVNKNIYNSSLSDTEKKNLIASYSLKLNEMFKASAIKEDTLTLNNRVNSIEYYSISILTFMSILIVVSYSVDFVKERKEGMLRRIFSISIDGKSLYLGKVGSLFILSTLSILCYVLFYRFTGKAFQGNILLLILAVIANGLLIASLTGLAISFFKDEKVARVALTSMMMIGIMFGGVFYPIDIIDNRFINIASRFTPNLWIADMYKKLILYNNLSSMLPSLGVVMCIVLVSFLIGSFKMSRTWEI